MGGGPDHLGGPHLEVEHPRRARGAPGGTEQRVAERDQGAHLLAGEAPDHREPYAGEADPACILAEQDEHEVAAPAGAEGLGRDGPHPLPGPAEQAEAVERLSFSGGAQRHLDAPGRAVGALGTGVHRHPTGGGEAGPSALHRGAKVPEEGQAPLLAEQDGARRAQTYISRSMMVVVP